MKYLIFGGKGMAGHVIKNELQSLHEVHYTTRNPDDDGGIFLDARTLPQAEQIIRDLRPEVVINAIGLLNRTAEEQRKDAIILNSLLPHRMAEVLDEYGGKLVHISTDCVFNGDRGDYSEAAETDGTSVYAKTKALGEVTRAPHLTVRTSIIGPELKDGIGLFHWFMKQKGEIRGFRQVYWNGVTTLELARAIEAMLQQSVSGLYQLTAPEKVSKYTLLQRIQDVFEKDDVTIVPDDQPVLDRTLKTTRTDFHYCVPPYPEMLKELKEWIEHQ